MKKLCFLRFETGSFKARDFKIYYNQFFALKIHTNRNELSTTFRSRVIIIDTQKNNHAS